MKPGKLTAFYVRTEQPGQHYVLDQVHRLEGAIPGRFILFSDCCMDWHWPRRGWSRLLSAARRGVLGQVAVVSLDRISGCVERLDSVAALLDDMGIRLEAFWDGLPQAGSNRERVRRLMAWCLPQSSGRYYHDPSAAVPGSVSCHQRRPAERGPDTRLG